MSEQSVSQSKLNTVAVPFLYVYQFREDPPATALTVNGGISGGLDVGPSYFLSKLVSGVSPSQPTAACSYYGLNKVACQFCAASPMCW